jgi:hypothetical protein
MSFPNKQGQLYVPRVKPNQISSVLLCREVLLRSGLYGTLHWITEI